MNLSKAFIHIGVDLKHNKPHAWDILQQIYTQFVINIHGGPGNKNIRSCCDLVLGQTIKKTIIISQTWKCFCLAIFSCEDLTKESFQTNVVSKDV